MTDGTLDNWQADFDIDPRTKPNFFGGPADLTSEVPQAHVMRHAFEHLKLDGILCSGDTPLLYFKAVDQITRDEVLSLHRAFWNNGGAPILVLVTGQSVQVYSGMSRPISSDQISGDPPSLVETLSRTAQILRTFLLSVESGEYFRRHARSFDPAHRVDHDLLTNLGTARDLLSEASSKNIAPRILDALLCRVVFTCYLFDRGVIVPQYLEDLGIPDARHLKDVLDITPAQDAKASLYGLFEALGQEFNGDLFSDDLPSESGKINNRHIEILRDFLHGTDLKSGQQVFWPYDFSYIPIETISAIYEHFLKEDDLKDGAFYTPRFLVEIVLDAALERFDTLLGKKFLDPACGSGIFLVGLFNRIADEWRQANPTARYDRRAKELLLLLQDSLFGVDKNPTACRITAFSLYLAYLNQLSPSDIRRLRSKRGKLPRLVIDPATEAESLEEAHASQRNIHQVDFFQDGWILPSNVDLVLGNPPWGGIAKEGTSANRWCANTQRPLPDKQIAVAFIWKAARHVAGEGRVCFVLPHGTLLNHGTTAVEFQRAWISQHRIHRILNLADLRHFLFREATHPAIVVEFNEEEIEPSKVQIDYWAPKSDWLVSQAEIIAVSPMDRKRIPVQALLDDLAGRDAPQIWTRNYWGTPRDVRLIERLLLYPRLRDLVRGSSEDVGTKPWVRAEGFQPAGSNDDPEKIKAITLPSRHFLDAKNKEIDLFVLPSDCQSLSSKTIKLRGKSNTNTDIYRSPHVLITKGFKRIAFADFDVSFRHAVRGIHGPRKDRNLLVFLAAYLRSDLAQYIAFHTSANRSMFHEEVHVNEFLRLPFPLPNQQPNPKRYQSIINKVASIVDNAASQAKENFLARPNAVEVATAKIEPLLEEYFDIEPSERTLVEDTLNILLPSIQPSQASMPVPTITPSSSAEQETYVQLVCETLNMWATKSQYTVRGNATSSAALGLGIVHFKKVKQGDQERPLEPTGRDIIEVFDRLRLSIPSSQRSLDPMRELIVFDGDNLYVVKPIGRRYWSKTAALNDADQIAGTILMHAYEERA